MSKLEISRGLGIYQGGLMGAMIIHELGFIDAFLVNNEFSVLVKEDHASVKSQGDKEVTTELCEQIATQELKYKNFKIEKDGNCFYIYKEELNNDKVN